ncbi:NAD(P)/FAD-dependent oxidoreductase [Mycobacterium deserti]|uniref:NAD(P)/FAD-dependent oxidoreductase n=1 Tax=Mycobacterium deserti TaxID=2978347 RepID=A0ABT2M4W6_9MYCO|nr:NAD(P)/FAD-dependent oxidoreductase [Mycobacterium deserti]MCT7657298.1 NAD(P)/FAD-dependent oxidoreductase [Mycobacterium deserti]
MRGFDVVIVGARCAGSPLAVLLARRGFRVCVVDKARFPSDTPSTHVIQPAGVAALEHIGVLGPALAAGAVPLDRLTLVNEDVRIDATLDPTVFPQPGLCVRRVTLDALLVDAAATAGADVRTGVRATDLIADGDRIVGVETDRGPIRARLVVGADGRGSAVATAVDAREYHVVPGGRVPIWAYFEGVDDREGRLRLGRLGEHAFLAAPSDSGLYMAGITTARRRHLSGDDALQAGIAGWPELADVLAGGRRVGPVRVMTRWHSYFRQSAGPGWVLIGDAGHFKDFTPAQGIADALRQAERLTADLPDDLAAPALVDTATRQWWRWRDTDAHPMYWFAADMGAPETSTPLVTSVLRDIAADRRAIVTLLRVLNHEVSPARLLPPDRLARAAMQALRDRPDRLRATGSEIVTALRSELRRLRARRETPPGASSVPAHR